MAAGTTHTEVLSPEEEGFQAEILSENSHAIPGGSLHSRLSAYLNAMALKPFSYFSESS